MNSPREHYLINQIKENEDQALVELFELYLPVVHKLQQKFYFRDFERADFYQEAMIVCYHSALEFDQAKGNFGTYFKSKLHNRIVSILRYYNAARRIGDQRLISLEVLEKEISLEDLVHVEYPMIGAVDCEFFERFFQKLSRTELLAFQISLGLHSVEEVIELLAVKEINVRRAKSRAYKKFIDEMFDK